MNCSVLLRPVGSSIDDVTSWQILSDCHVLTETMRPIWKSQSLFHTVRQPGAYGSRGSINWPTSFFDLAHIYKQSGGSMWYETRMRTSDRLIHKFWQTTSLGSQTSEHCRRAQTRHCEHIQRLVRWNSSNGDLLPSKLCSTACNVGRKADADKGSSSDPGKDNTVGKDQTDRKKLQWTW